MTVEWNIKGSVESSN